MKEQNKMKKLMIAAAVVCAAAVTQAAAFSWSTTTAIKTITAANVVDNGDYVVGSKNAKTGCANLMATLYIYEYGTETLVGSQEKSMSWSATGGKANVAFSIDNAAQGTQYSYKIILAGTDKDLTARGKETAYDYSAATIAQTYSGDVTTLAQGATGLSLAPATSWTVSGIEAVPEPTSGLLLLLGVAGLALKRKQK